MWIRRAVAKLAARTTSRRGKVTPDPDLALDPFLQ
jgi:hypothetical protein